MISSLRMPYLTARSAERNALCTMASMVTSRASLGSSSFEFSSIRRVSSAWSSDPQFTPMRTGLSFSMATSIMVRKLSSSFLPIETLPGLMRYFASALAQSGYFLSRMCPL